MNGIERPEERGKEIRRFALWTVLAVSVCVCIEFSGAHVGALFDRAGMKNAGDMLGGLLHPNVSAEFLQRIAWLSAESLLIGILGTFFAVFIGVALASVAMRVPDLPDPPVRQRLLYRILGNGARWFARFILGIFRAVPEIVWAYFFVRLLGLGPGAAVMAIALTVGGSIGKLYAELGESVDQKTIHALRATGAGRWSIYIHGMLPQVQRQWIAYALFRLECNIRSGTILGVVGAGGLGSEIALSIRYFEFDKLATALLAIVALVVALEAVGAWLRKKPWTWTFTGAAVGGGMALWLLDIPWRDLLRGNMHMMGDLASVHWDGEAISGIFKTAFPLVTQTIAMAWVATLSSAVIAFWLAPLATSTLITGSYLTNSYARRGGGFFAAHALLHTTKAILQVTRAIPEIMLALLFVMWVGPGPLAGILAIAVHNIGVMGRLYTDVYEEIETGPPRALQSAGTSSLGVWLFCVLPQAYPRMAAFTLYRFEVNVRTTVMVGFVGAGGIGDALNTAISLFHMTDLLVLLLIMIAMVTVIDVFGDHVRKRILSGSPTSRRWTAVFKRFRRSTTAPN